MSRITKVRRALIFAVVAVGIVLLSLHMLYNRAMRGYESPPEITLINASSTDLQKVTVYGSGFRDTIDLLPEGVELSFEVMPTGESSLAVEFTADGRQFADNDLAYLESKGGYWATITITDDFTVEADSGLRLLR